jgi:hypothetical protein
MSGGGGGGGGWFRFPGPSARVEKSVSDATEVSEYEAEANAYLQDVLAGYNSRDTVAIQKHIGTLQQAIEKDVEGETSTMFGGSVKKHTYVDGLSDIDILVVVNDSSLVDASPEQMLAYFERRIKERLPDAEVKTGTLAVTVTYADGTQLQVLPAMRTPTGVRIASQDGAGWSGVVRPQEFAQKLTSVNQSCGGKVVPVIKLFKGLQASLPSTSQLKGYHVESLAIEAFKNYSGRQTYKDMLAHFLRTSSQRVLAPVSDTTGQSRHVDDYLGAASSADRMRVSKSLDRLCSRLTTADNRASVDDVRDLFGE